MEPFSQAKNQANSIYSKTKYTAQNQEASKWIVRCGKIGFMAKGVVYMLIGVLATMTAFGIAGGEKAGRTEIFKIIYEQPFGRILLAILAVGLFGYMVWRLVEAIKNPDHLENDWKGIIKRIGYAFSDLLYVVVPFMQQKWLLTEVAVEGVMVKVKNYLLKRH